jgi:hypothetical protein
MESRSRLDLCCLELVLGFAAALSRAVPRQSWSNMLVEAFGRKNETYEFCKEVESFTEAAHAG